MSQIKNPTNQIRIPVRKLYVIILDFKPLILLTGAQINGGKGGAGLLLCPHPSSKLKKNIFCTHSGIRRFRRLIRQMKSATEIDGVFKTKIRNL